MGGRRSRGNEEMGYVMGVDRCWLLVLVDWGAGGASRGSTVMSASRSGCCRIRSGGMWMRRVFGYFREFCNGCEDVRSNWTQINPVGGRRKSGVYSGSKIERHRLLCGSFPFISSNREWFRFRGLCSAVWYEWIIFVRCVSPAATN